MEITQGQQTIDGVEVDVQTFEFEGARYVTELRFPTLDHREGALDVFFVPAQTASDVAKVVGALHAAFAPASAVAEAPHPDVQV